MSRVVVYAGTRNVYHNMTVAAKSLLKSTHVDRVWFLTEDDGFPEWIPDVILVKNVSGQGWFDRNGPNVKKRWSWMALMKLVLAELFPEENRVLWLDIDTICNKDISDLIETDLDGCLTGMAEEPIRCKRPFVYYNSGVMPMDLAKLRGETTRALVDLVNRRELDFPDQDAINLLLQTRIKSISPYWNSNIWITEVMNPGITHFAADRQYENNELWKQYDRMEWRVI